MVFDPQDVTTPGAKIKVIGVGGGGTNAVSTMIRSNIEGVDFVSANTDVQSLRFALAPSKIQIGKELTKGLGAAADPDVGRDAALEDRHQLQEALTGADMVFITAGMGGGTGTGGASVVSQIARECGALTVGVVTKPFNFEGKRRRKHAEIGIARLREQVDTLIVIPNDRLLKIATPDLTMLEAFKMADNVLVNAVRGISDIINVPGTINVDFADVKTVMASMGQALMGIGSARGDNRAVEAARQAISSPLLEDVDIEGATGILINITAGASISLMEINEACSIIQEAAHEDANIIFGAVIDESVGDEIRVTVIATGFPNDEEADYHVEDKMPLRRQNSYKTPRHTSSFMKPFNEKKIEPRLEQRSESRFESRVDLRPEVRSEARAEARLEFKNEAKDDSFNSLLNDGQRARLQNEPPPPAKSREPWAVEEEGEANHLSAEDLTRWTMDSLNSEPHVEDSIAKEDSPRFEPAISFDDPKQGHQAATHFDQPAPLAPSKERDEEGTFGFAGSRNRSEVASTLPRPTESTHPHEGFDSFFSAGSNDGLRDDIDKKIDEALELAERVKKVSTEEDDLDVPAFLRTSSKDLSLS